MKLLRLAVILAFATVLASAWSDIARVLPLPSVWEAPTPNCDVLNRVPFMANAFSQAAQSDGDEAGNRTGLSDTVNGNIRSFTWKYDPTFRLTNEAVGVTAPTGTVGYQLDAVGNRTNRTSTLSGVGATNNFLDANDRLAATSSTNAASLYFDPNGNQRTNTASVYLYDWANRLTNANSGAVVITYDANGNRLKKVTSSTTTVYLVAAVNPTGYPQVVEESTLSNNVPILSKVYSHGVSLISERRISSGNSSFYGYDGLGSTRFLTDGTANITDTYTYDAFGNEIASTGSTPNNYLYAGQQWDPDLGHYYLRARYYNPNTGRFLTLDTYGGDSSDPPSLHKYLYVANNPINAIDPDGHDGDLVETEGAASIEAGLGTANLGATISAETAAEASIIESESAIQVNAARAALQTAFEEGNGRAVGQAFNAFGRVAEATARNIIKTAVNDSVEIEVKPQAAQTGRRFLDFALRKGSKLLKLEVKYNLPQKGAALTRLAAQVQESVAAGDGGTTVIWSFRQPTQASVRAVQEALGANYSKVIFKSGVSDFLIYIKTFF